MTPVSSIQKDVKAATGPRQKTSSETLVYLSARRSLFFPCLSVCLSHLSVSPPVSVSVSAHQSVHRGGAGAVTAVTTCVRRTGGVAGPSRTRTPSSSVVARASPRRWRSRRTRVARCTASWKSTRCTHINGLGGGWVMWFVTSDYQERCDMFNMVKDSNSKMMLESQGKT